MKKNNRILLTAVFAALVLSVSALPVQAQSPDAAQIAGNNVESAITALKTAKVGQDTWEEEKAVLVSDYIRLTREKETLDQERLSLGQQAAAQKALNQQLSLEKKESVRVLKELPLFLQTVVERLKALISADAPFLKAERDGRLQVLTRTMTDPAVTLSEKYRKVMEALFIEAEYGDTIEVYQEKIALEAGQAPLVDIFRLGRVSLFYLTLDKEGCGVYTPLDGRWRSLDPKYLPAIRSAMQIGKKLRPAELLSLPIGRLNPERPIKKGEAL